MRQVRAAPWPNPALAAGAGDGYRWGRGGRAWCLPGPPSSSSSSAFSGSASKASCSRSRCGSPGTESAQGAELLRRHFGDSAPFAVLLRGPAAALDRQGPRLVGGAAAATRG